MFSSKTLHNSSIQDNIWSIFQIGWEALRKTKTTESAYHWYDVFHRHCEVENCFSNTFLSIRLFKLCVWVSHPKVLWLRGVPSLRICNDLRVREDRSGMTRKDVWHQCSEFYRSGLGVPAIWLFCVFVFNENYGKTCRKFLKGEGTHLWSFPSHEENWREVQRWKYNSLS